MATVDIIIPSINAEALTKCINKVIMTCEDLDFRLILIVDAPDDAMNVVLANMKYINNVKVIVNNTKLGIAKAINMGLVESNSPYIIFLNDDAYGDKNWLHALLIAANTYQDIGVFVPHQKGKQKGYFTDLLACGLLRREVFEKVGFLDENEVLCYGADADYFMRIKKANFHIVGVPDSQVDHGCGVSAKPEGVNKLVPPMEYLREKHGDIIYVDQHRLPEVLLRSAVLHYLFEGKLFNFDLPFGPSDTVLEIGAGDSPLHRDSKWVTLDIRESCDTDIVASLEHDWPIMSEKYDGLFGMFVAEHISWSNQAQFFAECFRVLKPGGYIFLVVPNTLEQCRKIVESGNFSYNDNNLLFGGRESGEWNGHRAGYSPALLQRYLEVSGFTDINVKPWVVNTDMYVIARKQGRSSLFDKKMELAAKYELEHKNG